MFVNARHADVGGGQVSAVSSDISSPLCVGLNVVDIPLSLGRGRRNKTSQTQKSGKIR